MIIDSGNRTTFDSGAVRDIQENKGRCDLMPLDVIAELYEMNADFNGYNVYRGLSLFVETGDTNYLYDCLFFGAPKTFDSLETMLLEVAKHFEEGCKKYGENNWKKGIPAHCYINSAVRHLLKHLRGDTDERHDRAFMWNVMCCIWTCEHLPELNDYKRGESK